MVVLNLFQRPFGLQVGHDGLAAGEAVQARILARQLIHHALGVHDLEDGQAVAPADLEVVGVVGRGDLQGAGAEVFFNIGVGQQGDFAARARQQQGGAMEGLVALVFRVHGHGDVAGDGLRAGGGHGDEGARLALHLVLDVVELAVGLLVLRLDVAEGRAAAGAPVDDVVALVDEALVVEVDEGLLDRLAQARVHGEALIAPIHAGPQAPQLPHDGGAALFFPLPDFFQKLLAAQVVAGLAFLGQFALHHVLGGDAGMIAAGNPQGIQAVHAGMAGQQVLQGVVQRVADVKAAGDIGRRDDDGKRRLGRGGVAGKIAALFPQLVPALFHFFGIVLGRKFWHGASRRGGRRIKKG